MADAQDDAAGTPGTHDPEAPPTDEEIREAEALAAALAGATAPNEDALFLRAVAHAHAPDRTPLDREKNERLVARAVDGAVHTSKARGRVVRVVFGGGLAAALAIAAAVLFVIAKRPPEDDTPKLAQSRSTQELFREPFRGGEASARIDRIAMARAGDLRENRFARWGVR